VHHTLLDARLRRGGRRGGADAPRGLQRSRPSGTLEPARRERGRAFLARDYPRWQKEWEVSLAERLQHSTAKNFERLEPRFEIRPSGERWFDVEMSLASADGEKFSAADIQRLVLSGNSTTRLKNGRIALIDTGALEEFNEVLRDCAPQQHAKGYRFSDVQAGFLDATLRQQPGWQVQAAAGWRDRARDRVARRSSRATARPARRGAASLPAAGRAWLQFLRENKFGGILADEMGLGKTLQTLAFIHSCHANRKLSGPVLIVCPTSLVFNWLAEAKRFTPGLKAVALHGTGRHQHFEDIARSDLVITSYALLRRDAERYRELEFDTLVLDEAQHIKNRQTQNALAVKAVRAGHRLVLTGTPMENSVLDLWSIIDFLMPGYLGSAMDFRERYEQPITRDKDEAVQARLGRRLRPFICAGSRPRWPRICLRNSNKYPTANSPTIRRRFTSRCSTSAARKSWTRRAQGVAKCKMIVLNALLRLRQICCDLRLLKMENAEFTDDSSGKLAMFGELLEEAMDGVTACWSSASSRPCSGCSRTSSRGEH